MNDKASAIVLAERNRFREIMEHPEGLSRPKSALNIALNSDMSAAQAASLLSQMPVESPFAAAMQHEGHVGVSPAMNQHSATGDANAARMAELVAGAKAFSVARGYRRG